MRWHGVFHVGLHTLDIRVDVAVRDQDVGPAIEIVIEEKAAEAESEQGSAADLRAWSFVDEESLTFVVIEREHLVRKISDQEAGEARVVVIRRVHTHACTGNTVFAESDSGDDRFFGKCSVAIVAIKLVRLGVIRKEKIGPAVIVVIEQGETESLRSGVAETGFLRDVFKCAAAAIVPETNGTSFVGFWRAIGFAFAVEGAIQVGRRRPLDIIGDDKIEMPILVVVNPGGAGAEFLCAEQARFLRDIRARAVTVVVKKMALAVGSDKKIVVAVVVVVTNRYARSEERR